MFPKLFQYYYGELHLKADELLEGLKIEPTTYAPKLPQQGGKYVYMNVKEYNYRWLKLKKDKNQRIEQNMNHSNQEKSGSKTGGFLFVGW